MAEADELTLTFLDSHPAEAARVLEALPAAEVSALFASTPPRSGALVLAAMMPPAAARVLGLLDEEQVLALLRAATTHAAVAMLRHIAEPKRSRLIAGLPPASAVASALLLGIPDDAVGAWADPEVLALAPNASAGDALERIRAAPESEVETIYVIDARRRLRGWISLGALLRAPSNTLLSSLAHPQPTTLSAMMPVASATSLRAWEKFEELPVLDHDQRLIGVLRRSALAGAVRSRARPARATQDDGSIAGALAASYWGIVSGLIGATLALLPHVKRISRDKE